MLFTFRCGLRHDEKYIAEFIFICLCAKSESSPMRRMIDEDAGTEVHQDLSSEASSAPELRISFCFALLMHVCSFRDIWNVLNHVWGRILSYFLRVFSHNDHAGGNP